MAKAPIFSTKFNVGSFLTKHGYEGDASNASLRKMELGIAAHFLGTGYINYVETAQRLDTLLAIGQNFTGEIWFKIDATIPQQHIWGFTNLAGDRFVLGIQHHIATACTLRWSELNGDEVSGGGLGWGRWYHCIFTCEDDVLSLYLNNVELGGSVANGDHWSNNRFVIGASQDLADHPFHGQVGKLAFWDYIFTDAERDRSYETFLAAKPLGFLKYPKYNPHMKATDLSYENGIVAGYNFIPSAGGVLTDLSGNHNHGTIYGPISTLDGMKFDGVGDYISHTAINLGKEQTFLVRFVVNGFASKGLITSGNANNLIYLNNSASINFRSGGSNILSFVFPIVVVGRTYNLVVTRNGTAVKMYRNGVESSSGTLTLATDNDFTVSNIGGYAGTFFDSEIQDVKYYNYAFSEAQAVFCHNQYAERVVLRESFEPDPVGSDSPLGWMRQSGSYIINELTAQDPVLKHLVAGTKGMQCDTDCLTAMPSKAAYGTYRFVFYNDNNTTKAVSIPFIADRIATHAALQGYTFYNANRQINLLRSNVGGGNVVFATGADYLEDDTLYEVEITRTESGDFTGRICGGGFGNEFVLIDDSGGGSNPGNDTTYTTSEYFVVDIDELCRFGELIILEGVIQ